MCTWIQGGPSSFNLPWLVQTSPNRCTYHLEGPHLVQSHTKPYLTTILAFAFLMCSKNNFWIGIVYQKNKSNAREFWLCYVLEHEAVCCCWRPGCGGGRAAEEIERETCKERERERERETCSGERERVSQIKLFGFRNNYGMY